MIVIFGSYTWWPKAVAFRNDVCLRCEKESIAVAQRSWTFAHIFWVPVLPLGRWTRWRCGNCGEDPAIASSVRRSLRITLLILLSLILFGVWFLVADEGLSGAPLWAGRAGMLAAFAGTAFWAFYPIGSAEFRERRLSVRPYNESACPLCAGNLTRSLEGDVCNSCGAEHRPLQKKDDAIAPFT